MKFRSLSTLVSFITLGRVGGNGVPARGLRPLAERSLLACLVISFLASLPLSEAWASDELEKMLPPVGSAGARFGGALVLSDDQLLVGAAGAGERRGQVYVYRGGPSELELSQVLRPLNGVGDSFGTAIAESDDTLFVGAPSEKRVYVFERDASDAWSLRQVIRGSGEAFGQVLAASGNTLAVAAPEQELQQGSARLAQAGAVHIYKKEGALWEEQELLRAPQAEALDHFGSALALRDGWLLVGARGVDRLPARQQGFALDAGAVFSFRRHSSGRWNQLSPYRIDPPVSYTRAGFGHAILLRGQRVVIAAPQDSAGSLLAGSVYVYRNSSLRPGQLVFEQRLDTPPGSGPNDRIGTSFGAAIALSPNQELLAIGAVGVPVDLANPDAGEVRLFRADPGGSQPYSPQSWAIRATDAEALDFGGGAVAVANSGELLMGALGDDDRGEDAGAVYRFDAKVASRPAPTLALVGLLCLGGGLSLARRRSLRSA